MKQEAKVRAEEAGGAVTSAAAACWNFVTSTTDLTQSGQVLLVRRLKMHDPKMTVE